MSYTSLSSIGARSTWDILAASPEIAPKSELTPEIGDPSARGTESLATARIRYRWCQRWTETLTHLRHQFEGDLDQYLLLLVFEQGEMARAVAVLEGALRKDLPARPDRRGMNAMSVAEICGIPRETARRKLKRLIERQAIILGPDGLYYLGVKRLAAPPVALPGFLDGPDAAVAARSVEAASWPVVTG